MTLWSTLKMAQKEFSITVTLSRWRMFVVRAAIHALAITGSLIVLTLRLFAFVIGITLGALAAFVARAAQVMRKHHGAEAG